ncbi:hypothetical protein FKP32DRAFT_658292 [Trametes sanguinea]|nr:hypothetical protein FKP32DRAFT_658292 [Trametes sanguinea]
MTREKSYWPLRASGCARDACGPSRESCRSMWEYPAEARILDRLKTRQSGGRRTKATKDEKGIPPARPRLWRGVSSCVPCTLVYNFVPVKQRG